MKGSNRGINPQKLPVPTPPHGSHKTITVSGVVMKSIFGDHHYTPCLRRGDGCVTSLRRAGDDWRVCTS